MSTRLTRFANGHPRCAEVTAPSLGQPVGAVYVVLGDEVTEVAIGWTGAVSGRSPEPEEMTGAPHAGSEYLYARGCRCPSCRSAATAARRARRQAAVARNGDGSETTPGPHQQRI